VRGEIAKALRDDCRAARRAVAETEQALRVAERKDREEHARAISRSRSATLEAMHAEAATAALEAAPGRATRRSCRPSRMQSSSSWPSPKTKQNAPACGSSGRSPGWLTS
jgi:hypothetical protein